MHGERPLMTSSRCDYTPSLNTFSPRSSYGLGILPFAPRFLDGAISSVFCGSVVFGGCRGTGAGRVRRAFRDVERRRRLGVVGSGVGGLLVRGERVRIRQRGSRGRQHRLAGARCSHHGPQRGGAGLSCHPQGRDHLDHGPGADPSRGRRLHRRCQSQLLQRQRQQARHLALPRGPIHLSSRRRRRPG